MAYPALPVPSPLQTQRIVTVNQFADSVYDGVDKLHELLLDESTKCPSENFVLAGYSQGALVIHEMMRNLPGNSSLASRIIGFASLADAGRVSMAEEDTYTAVEDKDPVLIARSGIWNSIMLGNPTTTGALPGWSLTKTVAMCHVNDIVCAKGWGSSIGQHLNYTSAELVLLAQKLGKITGAQ